MGKFACKFTFLELNAIMSKYATCKRVFYDLLYAPRYPRNKHKS